MGHERSAKFLGLRDNQDTHFCIGDVVENVQPRLTGQLGVIVAKDVTFQGSDEWWTANVASGVSKKQPFYHVLISEENDVSGIDMPPGFVRYNAQSTLRRVVPGDVSWQQVVHEQIDEYFIALDQVNGRYLPRNVEDQDCRGDESAEYEAWQRGLLPEAVLEERGTHIDAAEDAHEPILRTRRVAHPLQQGPLAAAQTTPQNGLLMWVDNAELRRCEEHIRGWFAASGILITAAVFLLLTLPTCATCASEAENPAIALEEISTKAQPDLFLIEKSVTSNLRTQRELVPFLLSTDDTDISEEHEPAFGTLHQQIV